MLTWAVIAYFAARRQSRVLALAAVGYFALVAVFFAVALVWSPDPDVYRPADVVGVLAWLLAGVGGAVHVAVLTAEDAPVTSRLGR
jgi:hypothetical protein